MKRLGPRKLSLGCRVFGRWKTALVVFEEYKGSLCGNAVLLMSCEACDMFLKRHLEKAFQSMYMRSWMLAVVQLVAFAAPFTYLKKLEGKELWSFRGKHSGPGKRVSCGQNTQLQSPVYKIIITIIIITIIIIIITIITSIVIIEMVCCFRGFVMRKNTVCVWFN